MVVEIGANYLYFFLLYGKPSSICGKWTKTVIIEIGEEDLKQKTPYDFFPCHVNEFLILKIKSLFTCKITFFDALEFECKHEDATYFVNAIKSRLGKEGTCERTTFW